MKPSDGNMPINGFTSFELAVLRRLLQVDDPTLAALWIQASQYSTVMTREFTGTGFWTEIEVLKHAPTLAAVTKPDFAFGDVEADIRGLNHGAGFLLFVRKKRLSMLEGYTYGEPWPSSIERYHLRYIGGQRDVAQLRRIWFP